MKIIEAAENLKERVNLSGDFNIFPRGSIVLIAVSIILLIIALISDRGDLTTAILVAVAMVNFLTGIIMVVFSGPKGIDPGVASMLCPALIVDRTGILAGLNIYGDAHLIPKCLSGSETLQFNPVGEYEGFDYKGSVFATVDEETAGVFSKPSSAAIFNHLESRYGLKIPSAGEGPIAELLSEVLADTLQFCDSVDVSGSGDEIVIELMGFALTPGCNEVRKESPKCCTVSPCPVCSLICTLVAEHYGSVTGISATKMDRKRRNLIVILRSFSGRKEFSGN